MSTFFRYLVRRELSQLENEMRRFDAVPSDYEPVGTYWTRKGSMAGTAAATTVQRRTRNPFLVAISSLLGVLGSFLGSMRDNTEISAMQGEERRDRSVK